MSFQKKPLHFIILCFVLFLLGFGLCFTLQHLFPASGEVLPDPPSTQQTQETQSVDSTSAYHFFSDDFLVYGKDDKGTPFFLKLSLNRKQRGQHNYIHYYFSNVMYGDINESDYTDFYRTDADIPVPKVFINDEDWFIAYKNSDNPDLSARENYFFTMQRHGQSITVFTDELQGDFLIRNTPEYTKYGSAAKAQILINGKSFEANVFVSSIYSNDYRKFLFFEGYDEVQPTTDYLAFWDENDSFYLIDHTQTKEENPYYRPHTWVLHKNDKDGSMKKAFDVELDFKSESGENQWSVTVPDLDVEIEIKMDKFFENSSSEGVGKGSVKTSDGTFAIEGFVERHR